MIKNTSTSTYIYILCILALSYIQISYAKQYIRLEHGNKPSFVLPAKTQYPLPIDPALSSYKRQELDLPTHDDNWAVIVSSSKYWFNYRHSANALTIYNLLKENGFPDDKIVLMIPEDIGCNPRSRTEGVAYNLNDHITNLVQDDIEIDFRGDEVTFETLVEVLTGRQSEYTPTNKRIFPTKNSNVLLYIAGHGGDQFMKFQDQRIMTAADLSNAVDTMHTLGRFKELFILVDTCQAATFVQDIETPNVLWGSSSMLDENSYSFGFDPKIGVSLLDRLTYQTIQFFNQNDIRNTSLNELFFTYRPDDLNSNPVFGLATYNRNIHKVPVSDFFVDNKSVQTVKHKQQLQFQNIYPLHTHSNNIINDIEDTDIDSLILA